MTKPFTDESLPGWRFTYDWLPGEVCEVTGTHEDGRSVTQRGGDLETTLAQCKIDARNRGDKMNREELLAARADISNQIWRMQSGNIVGGADTGRRTSQQVLNDRLLTILKEIDDELAELDSTAQNF